MHVYFSISKLLIGLLFGAVCGFVSGLFLTRSTYAKMTDIDENDLDMTDYSVPQMNQYDTEFLSFSERRRSAEKAELLKYIGMTAGAFLVWVLVLVFLFTSSENVTPKKVIANIGVGETVSTSNQVVDIVMNPIAVDAEGRAVVPYSITNKTDLPLNTVALTANVNGKNIECFRAKQVESEDASELKLEETSEPVVPGATGDFYVVLDSKSMKSEKISDINVVSVIFETCTVDHENGAVQENGTKEQLSQKVVK